MIQLAAVLHDTAHIHVQLLQSTHDDPVTKKNPLFSGFSGKDCSVKWALIMKVSTWETQTKLNNTATRHTQQQRLQKWVFTQNKILKLRKSPTVRVRFRCVCLCARPRVKAVRSCPRCWTCFSLLELFSATNNTRPQTPLKKTQQNKQLHGGCYLKCLFFSPHVSPQTTTLCDTFKSGTLLPTSSTPPQRLELLNTYIWTASRRRLYWFCPHK